MPIDEFIDILEQLRDENPNAYVYDTDGNPSYPNFDENKDITV